ncbi:MAG: DUF1361 domain-containing protein [Acidimicrobiia bacterium]|nr:DUF1361 domain-containing protein [Acidimicrobiia bacterium]
MDGELRALLQVWEGNASFMPWNLTLALVPLVLGLVLFRRTGRDDRPSWAWWLGLAAFLAFLPNAPYVLSDVVHLADDVRATRSDVVVVGVLAQYAAFFLAGLGAYVLALGELVRWLRARGWAVGRVLAVEVVVHAACSVGVYLGRVPRFNSWDLLTRPDAVATTAADHLSDRYPVALVLATFVVLVMATAVLRSLLGSAWQAAGRLRQAPA